MNRLPDFIIIGAMKAATSTLHEQLASQPGIFMSTPKEPYFFSDDPVYANGIDWYCKLFADANADAICGESTTHYSKLPTYPLTIERMRRHLPPDIKFIYIMRHPIDRLVSQYIHQWSEREITVSIHEAIERCPELIAYSQYCRQLTPYFDAFGKEKVLPVFYERLSAQPQHELERICRFIAYDGQPIWQEKVGAQNISSQRMRSSPWRDKVAYAPGISAVRERLIPQTIRDKIKGFWQLNQRPELTPAEIVRLTQIFDEELSKIGKWLNIELSCNNFKSVTSHATLDWT